MPDGRIGEDGLLRTGVSYMEPYGAIWASLSLTPWLEFSGRYTQIDGVPAFGGQTGFGDFKDKAFDLKIRLLEESEWLPAIAYSRQDFHGTGQFPAWALAASKLFELGDIGTFDLTLGYGSGRIDGWYGGLRWRPSWNERLAFVAEYDAIDYRNDFHARRTGQLVREGGLGLGVEYRTPWFDIQVAHQDDTWGVNLSLSAPLQLETFIPKTGEPAPFQFTVERHPPLEEWSGETPEGLQSLYSALAYEGFRDPRLLVSADGRIQLAISQPRYTLPGRAVGRAARVVAFHAPDEATGLDITFVEYRMALATWRFDDLDALRRYWNGEIPGEDLQPSIRVSYVDADAYARLREEGTPWEAVWGSGSGALVTTLGPPASGFAFRAYQDRPNSWLFQVQPVSFALMFNDPNGAFKWELYSHLLFSNWLSDSVLFSSTVKVQLWENISDTIGSSNSLLPRVRSDIPRYRRDGQRVKLMTTTISHFGNPADRIYTWVSAGILEEMFAGVGGEVLYLPERGNWAMDFSAWGVRQRDYAGRLGFFDYQTVTALGALHYRVPEAGITFTARAGRFLARDQGVRLEMRRRFLSGIEVGAWYSHTDANDITSPGRPGNPYRDKGVFLHFSATPFLARESATSFTMAMAPWARDPGQMVLAGGALYERFERRLMLNDRRTPWTGFGN